MEATRQLKAAYSYVRDAGSPRAAMAQVGSILKAVRQLSDFPESGRPGRVAETRELVVQGTPYLVTYRIAAREVQVLAVLHGARRWPSEF